MKHLEFSAPKTTQGRVQISLEDNVPDVYAKYMAALLSFNYRKDEDSQYLVEKIKVGYNMCSVPTRVAEYCDATGTILIDVYKCAVAAIKQSAGRMDYRYFTFRVILESFCHEAIHARNAAMYPHKYGYGIIGDRSKEAMDLDEEVAQQEKMELMYVGMDVFDISPVHEDVDWLISDLRKAAYELDAPEDLVAPRNVLYKTKSGFRCYSWREFLRLTQLADAGPDELLGLPEAMNGQEVVTPEVAPVVEPEVEVVNTSSNENMYDDEGFLKPEYLFAEEEVDSFGYYNPEEPSSPPADGHGGVPQNQMKPEETPNVMENGNVQEDPTVAKGQGIIALAENAFMRCANHFFEKCGWDGRGQFHNPAGVLEPVYIGDLPYKEALIEVHSVDEMGRRKLYKNPGDYIKGVIAGKSGLPMFHLVFDFFGQRVERRVVPQNTKVTDQAGKPKWSSQAAMNGEKLVWVINAKPGPNEATFTHKINNDKIIKLNKPKDKEE